MNINPYVIHNIRPIKFLHQMCLPRSSYILYHLVEMLGFQKLDSCRSTTLIVLFPGHAIKLSWTQVQMHKFWAPKQGILISKWALSGCGVNWSRADRVSSLSQRATLKASAARIAFTAKARAGSGYKVFVRWMKNIRFPHSSWLCNGWSLPPRLDRREGLQNGEGSHRSNSN